MSMLGYRQVVRALRRRAEMSTLERMKLIADKGARWPRGAEVEVLIALPKLLAVVNAAEATAPFCEDYSMSETGMVPCGVCPTCTLRLSLAALDAPLR